LSRKKEWNEEVAEDDGKKSAAICDNK